MDIAASFDARSPPAGGCRGGYVGDGFFGPSARPILNAAITALSRTAAHLE